MYIIHILELIERYGFCASIRESFALAEMLLDFVRYTQSPPTVVENYSHMYMHICIHKSLLQSVYNLVI